MVQDWLIESPISHGPDRDSGRPAALFVRAGFGRLEYQCRSRCLEEDASNRKMSTCALTTKTRPTWVVTEAVRWDWAMTRKGWRNWQGERMERWNVAVQSQRMKAGRHITWRCRSVTESFEGSESW